MTRMSFAAAKVVALALLLGAAASTSTAAFALPHMGLHRHPADPNDTRVSLVIYNKADMFRDVIIDGHVYTLLSHGSLTVKAPAGTAVYANSTGALHRKGDLLFSVDRAMQDRTIPIS
ncbi:MAG: hypothetical protein M3O02_10735 [Acidobacteriota bacterium]|nr:hypothetical protein [Acidobacteriota bacterium]